MGRRMTFWVAPRRALEELASVTLRQAVERCGAKLELGERRGQRVLFTQFPAGEPLADEREPFAYYEDDGPIEAFPDTPVRVLTARDSLYAVDVLRFVSGMPWPGVRLAQWGWKRWWLGALAYEAERQHMREVLRPDLEHLARVASTASVGVPWFDALAKEVVARDPLSGPIFGAPNGPEHMLVELEPERLERLLAWASTVEQFSEQPGTPGRHIQATDPREWHEYVSRHVRLLREVERDEVVVVQMG